MRHSLFILFAIKLLLGCSIASSQKTEHFSKKEPLPELNIVAPENILFTYELQLIPPDTIAIESGKKRIRRGHGELSCYLTNNNSTTAYFIKYTCSDHPGKIVFDQPECGTYQNYYCNGSVPEIIALEPNVTKRFSTNVYTEKFPNVKLQQWHIKFVNRYIDRDVLFDNSEYDSILSISYEKCSPLIPQHKANSN